MQVILSFCVNVLPANRKWSVKRCHTEVWCVPTWHRWMKEAEELKTSSQLLLPSTVALLPLAASLGCQQQSTFVATRCRFDSWWFFFIQLSTWTPPSHRPWSAFSACTTHSRQLQWGASAIRTFISLFAAQKYTFTSWISHNVTTEDTNFWPSLTPVSHKFGSDYNYELQPPQRPRAPAVPSHISQLAYQWEYI